MEIALIVQPIKKTERPTPEEIYNICYREIRPVPQQHECKVTELPASRSSLMALFSIGLVRKQEVLTYCFPSWMLVHGVQELADMPNLHCVSAARLWYDSHQFRRLSERSRFGHCLKVQVLSLGSELCQCTSTPRVVIDRAPTNIFAYSSALPWDISRAPSFYAIFGDR